MWLLIVKQLSCNKIEAFFAHLYIFSFLGFFFNSSDISHSER